MPTYYYVQLHQTIIVSERSKLICPHPYVDKLQSCFMSCSKLLCCLLASNIATRILLNITCFLAVLWCHANQHGKISTKMKIVDLLHWWLDDRVMCFKSWLTPYLVNLLSSLRQCLPVRWYPPRMDYFSPCCKSFHDWSWGISLPWLEWIFLIEGIQDICPWDFSHNSSEILCIMLHGRDDLFLDTLNVTLILTLPAITSCYQIVQSCHQYSRDKKNLPYSHRMVWILLTSNHPTFLSICHHQTIFLTFFSWSEFPGSSPRIQNILQDDRKNLTKTLIVL